MKKNLFFCFVVFCFSSQLFAQIPANVAVQIVKAEDERRFDKTLEDLMKNPNAKIRARAALAAGRIGDERAVPVLANLLEKDSEEVRAMAAFALGEIESILAADALSNALQNLKISPQIRAKAIEAAGKIAAANAKNEKAKVLGEAILSALAQEHEKRSSHNREIISAGLTAALRARPAEAEKTVVYFTDAYTPEIRADALNTLARLRAKNANKQARQLLRNDGDPIVRANAARVLGAAEDKDALQLLLEAATDTDPRVRVSAYRSLANLNEASIAEKLIPGVEMMKFIAARQDCELPKKRFNSSTCISFKGELLEIAATLGRLLSNTNNFEAIYFLYELNEIDKYQSPEIEIAMARIAPAKFLEYQRNKKDDLKSNWRAINATMAGIGELANAPDSAEIAPIKEQAKKTALEYIRKQLAANLAEDKTLSSALSAYAAFKTADLPQLLRDSLRHKDPVFRAAVIGLLGDLPPEQIQFGDFEKSFRLGIEDEKENDALMATIETIGKQKTERATDFLKDRLLFLSKLNPKYGASKYLARRRIIALLKEKGAGDFSSHLGNADTIFSDGDYRRAVSRKSAKAVVTTAKGAFTIEFFPEAAPLTVDNFIKLARSGYYNNLMIHRVVPNFVMQDGDPRGDGSGGPGWSIRCEVNQIPYERGMVGMALSGKDTGGSQWFVTHSPQPHLDGGYTVFGKVNEVDMEIVDNLARGDKILSVKIVESGSPQRTQRTQRRK